MGINLIDHSFFDFQKEILNMGIKFYIKKNSEKQLIKLMLGHPLLDIS